MGKNLKGKECGKGICQRKDGLYYARFVDKMGTMFKAAKMNNLIAKHPMDGVRYTKPVRAVDDIKYLTVDEQEKFLEAAAQSRVLASRTT